MSAALLDVSVLLALFHDRHIHHQIAHDWFEENRDSEWASCPMTENGLIRILGHAGRIEDFVPIPKLVSLLENFCGHTRHRFWSEDISIRDDTLFDVAAVRGHGQLADAYLLGLAVKNRGRFVTFDQHVALAAVKGARREHLVVIAPAA